MYMKEYTLFMVQARNDKNLNLYIEMEIESSGWF